MRGKSVLLAAVILGTLNPAYALWEIKAPEIEAIPGMSLAIPIYGTTEGEIVAFQFQIAYCDDSMKIIVDSLTLKGYGNPYTTIFDTISDPAWTYDSYVGQSYCAIAALTFSLTPVPPFTDGKIAVLWAHFDDQYIVVPDTVELDITEYVPCVPDNHIEALYVFPNAEDTVPQMTDGAIFFNNYGVLVQIDPPQPQFVNENDSLTIIITGTSIDTTDNLEISVVSGLEPWMNFTPSQPDYSVTGSLELNPGNCDDGMYVVNFEIVSSHFDTTFFVTDTIFVLNSNMAPYCMQVLPGSATFSVGKITQRVEFLDPDMGCPSGHTGDSLSLSFYIDPVPATTPSFVDNGDGTGLFEWVSEMSDTGIYVVGFIGEDRYGAADTVEITVRIVPEPQYVNYNYKLQLKQMCAYSALAPAEVHYPVYLSNNEPVAGYEILLAFDPACLTLIGVQEREISGYSSEFFDYSILPPGVVDDWPAVRVVAARDMPGGEDIPPIPPDTSQAVFDLVFEVEPGLPAGQLCDVKFVVNECSDNSLTDSIGQDLITPMVLDEVLVGSDTGACGFAEYLVDSCGTLQVVKDVALVDGFGFVDENVSCADGSKCPMGCLIVTPIWKGDVNLNGIPFEISDISFYTRVMLGFFPIDDDTTTPPEGWTLGNWQIAAENSDLNENGAYWEISDLIRLINVVNGMTFASVYGVEGSARISCEDRLIQIDASTDIGGVFLEIFYEGKIEDVYAGESIDGMRLEWSATEDKARILLWSPESRYVPKGEKITLQISGAKILRLEKADVADKFGNTLSIEQSRPSLAFLKVVPNPSGKTVKIRYIIGDESDVILDIYDVSGRLVRKLRRKHQKAGSYIVTWNGRDDRGRIVSSGIYLLRANVGEQTQTRKIVLLR